MMNTELTPVAQAARIVVVSDLHLGHRNTPTRHIVENLNRHVTCPKVFSKLDIFFVAGDLFDDLLLLTQDEIAEIQAWLFRTLALCLKYRVKFRLLKGTPSHDRDQSDWVDSIAKLCNEHFNCKIDFKYFNDISLEYFPEFDLKVLYIPDEIRPTGVETLRDAKQLALSEGWDGVDLAIMHGFFKSQLPACAVSPQALDENDWQDFVKGQLFIGHVHTHTVCGRIFAQGSFDRLSHGQEEDKGFALANLGPGSAINSVEFVTNPQAQTYKTLTCNHSEVDRAITYIDKMLANETGRIFVKIKAQEDKPILLAKRLLKQRYPLVHWDFEKIKSGEKQTREHASKSRLTQSLIINRSTVRAQLLDRLKVNGVSKEVIHHCSVLIDETLGRI